MIDVKKIGLIALVLSLLFFGVLRYLDVGAADRAVRSEEINRLTQQIAHRDLNIRERDRRNALTEAHLATLARADSQQTRRLVATKDSVRSLREALDVDAAAHGGLVPILAVHVVEAKMDAAQASCEQLVRTKDLRIGELETLVASQKETRVDLNANRAAGDTITKDTVAVLKPPWYRRFASWTGHNVVTAGVAIGVWELAKATLAKR